MEVYYIEAGIFEEMLARADSLSAQVDRLYEKNRENQCFVMWVTADRNLRNLRIAESLCPVSGKQWKSSDSSGRISDEWGKGSSMGNRRKCTSGWADIQDSTDR